MEKRLRSTAATAGAAAAMAVAGRAPGARASLVVMLASVLALGVGCQRHSTLDAGRALDAGQLLLRLDLPASHSDDPCDARKTVEELGRESGYVGCGPLARFEIRETLGTHEAQLGACGRMAPRSAVTQRYLLGWTITDEGRTTDVTILEAPTGGVATADCLAEELRQLPFPKPRGGGVVKVAFPFVFASQEEGSPRQSADAWP